jgi:DNA-3-methyladenine glycosylase II
LKKLAKQQESRFPPGLPTYWPRAVAELAAADPVMAGLVARYEGTGLVSRGEPFVTLLRSIVGQQISVKAADAVWRRFIQVLPAATPEGLLAVAVEDLRAAGLSARKVEYVRHLAERFCQLHIRPELWPEMEEAAVLQELVSTRGIGRWTAEMVLIFNLMRPDVFPLDDKGLIKAVALLYCDGQLPDRQRLLAIGERWRPWRTVATWHLWRSLDPVPVEY